MKRNKKIFIIIGILFTLVTLISTSYAFFYYVEKGDEITLSSGDINISFTEGSSLINLGSTYPKSDTAGKIDYNYYDFEVSGTRGKNDNIRYEIQIEEEANNTLDERYIKVYLTDQDDNSIFQPKLLSDLKVSKYNDNRVIYEDLIWNETETNNYRLRVWVDSSYTENVSKTFNFKVKLYAVNEEFGKLLYDAAEETLKDNLLADDGDARIVSGTNDINNYVWYSGKLWRIVSLNNDGSIKLITDESITIIYWGENTTYEGSYIYQWLNEDFKDTLYNYEELLVTDYKWNATMTTSISKPSETTMVTSPVGTLNIYEYVKSYNKTSSSTGYLNNGYSTGYLNNGYDWWLMNPGTDSSVWGVSSTGYSSNGSPTFGHGGARPSINLKSNIQIVKGDGSKSNPYKIVGDIKESTQLNKRVSGEYVKFDNELYRIVSIEDNITKITKVDYLRDDSNAVIIKYLASSATFGKSTNTKTLNYWDYYLNNTWYNNIDIKYKNMIVKGTWYLGSINDTYKSYKSSICETGNTTELTKTCKRTTNIYEGYVGLGRMGEIFTSQIGEGYKASSFIWTITPYSDSSVWLVHSGGNEYLNGPAYLRHGARPSVNLKSNIQIVSGEGTKESPFEISM